MKPLVAPVAVLVLLAAACSVETSALGPAEPTPAPAVLRADASTPGASTPAGPTGEREDASVAVDASVSDAAPDARDAAPRDAGADVLQPPTSCDRDGDGRLAVVCGGDDCCDTDARVHRGVTAYFDTPTMCGGFDYDCDGYGYRQYATVECRFKLLDWCAGEGFQSDTACGEIGTYATCGLAGFSCGPQSPYAARQPCH